MKKADLIDAILGAVDGGGAADGDNRPKRVRSRRASEADEEVVNSAAESPALLVFGNHVRGWIPGSRLLYKR